MLLAVLEDLARIKDCHIVTTWDARLGNFTEIETSILTVVEVSSPEEEQLVFRNFSADCDAAFVIAPEFHGILADRCRIVESVAGKWLGCAIDAIELCADKLKLAAHLSQHDLPVIETALLDSAGNISVFDFPVVVKPREGAGSQRTYLVSTQQELEEVVQEFSKTSPFGPPIVQPSLAGERLSVAAIISRNGEGIEILPIAEQRLSTDGRFRYLGGRLPVSPQSQPKVERLVKQACDCIEGLGGYVGFDLIIPEEQPDEVVIVEINPRLTTSYLGYRVLSEENLSERILFPERFTQTIRWKSCEVQFLPDGNVEIAAR